MRCCEELRYLDTEMSHYIAAYFNQCLGLERRLSTLTNSEKFEVSNILQGLYSVNAKQLYERVQLFAACNMFKKFVTPSLQDDDSDSDDD